jgi:hypothetical protein
MRCFDLKGLKEECVGHPRWSVGALGGDAQGAIDPVPINLAGKLRQLVLEVDDLLQPRPEQIAFTRRLWLLWSHRAPRCRQGIMLRRPRESQKRLCKVPLSQPAKPCDSKTRIRPENRLSTKPLPVNHGRLIISSPLDQHSDAEI